MEGRKEGKEGRNLSKTKEELSIEERGAKETKAKGEERRKEGRWERR